MLLTAGFLNASAATTVTVSPAALKFSWQMGSTLPGTQTLSVTSSAAGTVFTAGTPVGAPWLSVAPEQGRLPASLTVRVNPGSLTPGTWTSAVTINAAGGAYTVAVTLVVSLPAGGVTIQPTGIPLISPGTLRGSFALAAGPQAVTWSLTSGEPWLTVSPSAGAVLPGEAVSIGVTADPTGLFPQSAPYIAKITILTAVGAIARSQTVTVSLTVNPGLPSITSVWPPSIPVGSPDTVVTIRGTNFYSGTTITAAGSPKPLKVTLANYDVILATIPQAMLSAPNTLSLTATNPPPGGASAPFGLVVGNGPAIGAVTNSASYALGPVSPGEIVSIFGQNLGPATAVQMTDANGDGFADTSVAGVNVIIDGHPAPLIYASTTQVNVQVPYNVSFGAGKVLSIAFAGAAPAQTTVTIASAAPGIFSADGSGLGQAVALDDDGANASSINSSTNPAKIGQPVVLYATGEGNYASLPYPVETGLIVPMTPPASGAYPQLNPLPVVTIGGVNAKPTDLLYAGPIPGCILGLLEIHVKVPAGATTGNAVPVSVTIGGVTSQAGVTLAVHP